MKFFFTLLTSLLVTNLSYSQTFQLNYSYKEVCSDQLKKINIPIDLSNSSTLAFFGYSKTFTPEEIQSNDHISWMDDIYSKWREYYPCAEIKGIVTESAKSASDNGDVDLSQPIVIMSADLGYRNGGVITTSGGYNQTNLKTQTSNGLLLTLGTNYIGNIGYYRINPLSRTTSLLINSNILLLETNIIGNLTTGILGDLNKVGTYFTLHTVTFGKLNGYPFQDQTILVGHSKKWITTRRLILSTNLIGSYTYRVKVFNLDYWFEDYIEMKPFVNLGFRITPTFGLNISYTTSVRTDINVTDRYGILIGGRVLF